MADHPESDAALLARFAETQDEAAFGQLVARHGRLVWGVCRRRLDRLEDAEDAFQTTFLILAIKSGTIRQPAALAGWLHRTATRVARRVATQPPREPTGQEQDAGLDALAAITRREMIAAVDEELQALPARYRDALILFHLEGCARQDVASRLGVSEPTVKSRLSRGRSLLRSRLARRGVALPLLLPLAADPLPAGAAESTTRLATSFGRTRVTPGDLLTTTLSQGTHPMLSMITSKAGLAVLAVCLGLTITWAVKGLVPAAADGDGTSTPAIDTTLTGEHKKPFPATVALLNDDDLSTEVDDESATRGNDPVSSRNNPVPYYPIGVTPVVQDLLDKLDEITRAEFPGIPLSDALQGLAAQHEINIVIDVTAIEEAGLSSDARVDLFLNGITLRSALKLILDPHDLAYVIEDEVLKITTESEASLQVVTRAYPATPRTGEPITPEFGERLQRLLEAQHGSADTTIEKKVEGGVASVFPPTPVIEVFQDRIVVAASREDQKRLRQLLKLIYLDPTTPPPSPPKPKPVDQPSTDAATDPDEANPGDDKASDDN